VRVLSVVGARPQFVKAAVLSAELRRRGIEEILVHTGQHYDREMSGVFFEELPLPKPAYDLGVGSASHGVQTGLMMERLDPIVRDERPDWLVVYGDTNSTLAAALVGAKCGVPVAHVEAGLRSFNRGMPEETNRVVADHVSTLLLAPSQSAACQLAYEGIAQGVVVVGDLMVDLARRVCATLPERPAILTRFGIEPRAYAVATVHRAANTDDAQRFAAILDGLRRTVLPVIFPVHPRTRALALSSGAGANDNIVLCEPLSYMDMLALTARAAMVFTDSGGLQKEAFVLGVPCTTLREETEWVETLEHGWNVLVGANADAIALSKLRPIGPRPSNPFGEGAARAIASALLRPALAGRATHDCTL
jgi:UDP-GlcNAc3NAcA epimerase